MSKNVTENSYKPIDPEKKISTNDKNEKIVILGAGPTAIGALYRIFQLQHNNLLQDVEVKVIEQEVEAGGLARTITDQCGFSWDLGVHVTGASKYVDFVELLHTSISEWNIVRRVVKADMTHVMSNDDYLADAPTSSSSSSTPNLTLKDYSWNYVPYPVQNSIPYFPETLKHQCLVDLEKLNEIKETPEVNQEVKTAAQKSLKNEESKRVEDATNQKPKLDENFGEFSSKIFGSTIQSIFIRPYNEKVWTVKLEEMSCKWLEGRVPRIDKDQILRRCALRRDRLILEDAQQQSVFRYPANMRGIGEMWNRIVALRFPTEIFHYCRRAVRIDALNKRIFTINLKNGKEECFDYTTLISTIPITELIRLTKISPELPLRHSKVILVGIGLRLPQSELASQLSWAYYPRPEIIFYRSTVLSNFSSSLVPDAKKFWSVLCEIGMHPETPIKDEGEIIDRVINDLVSVGMITSKEQVFSNWLKVLQYGYPIPTLERDTILTEYHTTLHKHQIFSRGRFGGWRYEISNQDHSFECGLQVVDRILFGIPENLYDSPQ